MTTTLEKNFQTDLDAIRSDIAALTENVGKLAAEASKARAAMANTVGKAANASARVGAKMWDEVGDLGHDASEALTDAAHAGMSNLETRIKQKPMSSVLFALGAGVLVGLIGLNFRK
jgi:ElaB/YqjD/DUF883 family membrane-anchored ribosome-binding protein